jgi:hypothetical protein
MYANSSLVQDVMTVPLPVVGSMSFTSVVERDVRSVAAAARR